MPLIALGLGSNMNDRVDTIRRAVQFLKDRGLVVREMSKIYETPAWGRTDQSAFANAAIVVSAEVSPIEALRLCKGIERDLGRTPRERWGPREIDIDVLLCENQVVNDPELTVPHALLHERAFALVPLAEIAGHWVHPLFGKTVRELAEAAQDREKIIVLSPCCEAGP